MRWIALIVLAALGLPGAEAPALLQAVLGPKDDPQAIVLAVEQGADSNARHEGRSLAGIAARLGKLETLKALLLAGADPGGGSLAPTTPALLEAIRGNRKAAIALLLECGADPCEAGADGLTPVMAALDAGDNGTLELLLEAGALSGPAKRKELKRVVKAAREQKKEALAARIEAFDNPSVDTGAADALRPAPGSDLSDICNRARDGQTIVLQEGVYTGPLVASGKTLRVRGAGIKTVVNAGDAPVAVYAQDAGKLILEAVEILPGKKATAGVLVAKGSEATLIDCQISGAKEVGIQCDGGRLTVIGTRIVDSRLGVYAGGTTDPVVIRNCTLAGLEQGVAGNKSQRLDCVASLFKDVGQSIVSDDMRSVRIQACDFVSQKPLERRPTIYLKNSGAALVAGNRIVHSDTALYLEGASRQPAFVRNNTILRAQTGVAALVNESAPLLTGNLIAAAKIGVLLEGPARAMLCRNTLLCNDGAAVIAQKKAGVWIDRSTLSAGTALVLQDADTARVKLSSTLLSGAVEGPFEDRMDTASRRLRQATLGAEGAALRAAVVELCDGIATPAKTFPRDGLDDLLRVQAATERVRNAADDLAQVELKGRDFFQRENVLPSVVYADTGEAPEHLHFAPADLRDAAQFMALLKNPTDPVTVYLAALPSFAALAAKPLDAAGLAQALTDVVDGPMLYEKSRFSGVNLSFDSRRWAALKKLQPNELQAFNRRLLEDAYPGLLHPSRPLAYTFVGRPALLPPGRYLLQYRYSRTLAAKIELSAGATRTAELTISDGLWFRLRFSEKRERSILLQMKPQREIQEGVSRLLKPQDNTPVARPDVSAAEKAAALALAWKTYPRLLQKGAPADEFRRYMLIEAAERIFSAHGGAEDAKKLCKLQGAEALRALAVASRIERRLGVLDTGEVSKILDGTDVAAADAAAGLLCEHGFERARGTILAQVNAGRQPLFSATRNLVDSYSPEILKAMRTLVQSPANEPRASVPAYAWLYLLAYGVPDDRKLVTDMPHDIGLLWSLLALTADNLEPLAAELPYYSYVAASVASLTCHASPEWAPSLIDAIERTTRDPDVFYNTLSSRYPTDEAARRFSTQMKTPPEKPLLNAPPWLAPSTATPAQVLALLEEGKSYLPLVNLDRLDPSALARSCAKFPGGDMVLVALKTTTQAHGVREEIRDGVERRAFAFKGADGSVLGHLEARPRLTNKTLSVDLRFRFAFHYEKVLAIVFAHDYVFLHPTRDDGAQLLGRVFIQKNGRELPLALERRENGQLVFSAELDEERLDGWNLYIELNYFKESALLAYDLSASDLAWTLRRLRVREAPLQATVAAQPKNPIPLLSLARMVEAQGRLDAARLLNEQALTLDPRRRDVLFSLAAAYLAHKRPAGAIDVLNGKLKVSSPDADGWRLLAQAQYDAGQYAAAAQSATTALKLEPARRDTEALRIMALMLSGDAAAAAAELSALPPDAQTTALLALRYIAAKSAKTGDADAHAAAEAHWNALNAGQEKYLLGLLLGKSDAEKIDAELKENSARCIAQCYLGYAARFRGSNDAQSCFKAAVATNERGLLAWRLAAAALKVP